MPPGMEQEGWEGAYGWFCMQAWVRWHGLEHSFRAGSPTRYTAATSAAPPGLMTVNHAGYMHFSVGWVGDTPALVLQRMSLAPWACPQAWHWDDRFKIQPEPLSQYKDVRASPAKTVVLGTASSNFSMDDSCCNADHEVDCGSVEQWKESDGRPAMTCRIRSCRLCFLSPFSV